MSKVETWEVHTGRPSWHQKRAGHLSSAITSGFDTREEAEEWLRRFQERHPGEPAFVKAPPPLKVVGRSHRYRG